MGAGPWGPRFSPGPTSFIKRRSERTCPRVSGEGWHRSEAAPYEDTAGAAEGYSLTWQHALPQHLSPPGGGSRAPAIDAPPEHDRHPGLALPPGQGPRSAPARSLCQCSMFYSVD